MSKKMPRLSAVSRKCWSMSPAKRTRSPFCAALRSATRCITASILRDSAIIAAAKLSQRYITDRQLPDKAIDLIDEAGSRIRMEIDSKPESMDRLERRLIQLKIEREAVKKETSVAAEKELAQLDEQIT